MKTWFVVSVTVATLLVLPVTAGAASHDAHASKPDFDAREEAATRGAGQANSRAVLHAAGEAQLRQQLPGITVSRDRVMHSPRQIALRNGFLTGPNGRNGSVSKFALDALPASDPHRVIRAFVNEHAAVFGHDADALTSARVQRDYVAAHNGLRTVVWQQTLDGIPVFKSLLTGHITARGELVSLSSLFLPEASKAADAGTPNRRALLNHLGISAARAVSLAAANAGVTVAEDELTPDVAPAGAELKQTLTSRHLFGPTYVELAWLPMSGDSLRLCWQVYVTVRAPELERYLVLVDVQSGEILLRHALKRHISPATYNVYTGDSPSPFSPGWATAVAAQPPLTNRVMVTISALDTNASPQGWIPDGQRETRGNNVLAHLDRNLDYAADGPLPQGVGTNRVFDFPLNLAQQPAAYTDASVVHLFYAANVFHDRLYQLGFTEGAGNFQATNFLKGGIEGDPVLCLAQAGADAGQSDNAFFLPGPDGQPGLCAMFVWSGPNPNRDGSLDKEVVFHELTHGVSDRLVGGGVGLSALQSAGMGEGWSDFVALCLLSEDTDDPNGNYAAGGYATYQLARPQFLQNYYFGIRRYPFTTAMDRNPLTFKDIDPTRFDVHPGVPISPIAGFPNPAEVHAQGEIWTVTLREIWSRLVTRLGGNFGNKTVLQIVIDGMKLSPENPTFLEARDAIILADLTLSGGANYDDIWISFAKRGMGASALCPPANTTVGVVEAYNVPDDVITGEEVPIGLLRLKITPSPNAALLAGAARNIFVRVTDGPGVTNATVTATISSGGTLNFLNNGSTPDVAAADSVYSATLSVPDLGLTSLTLTIVASAPGKDTVTNVVTYLVVGPAINDNFAAAIKVPLAGTNYLFNNELATLQTNEPDHGGITSADHSIWWKYTPGANTNVLVDAGGSDFRTIVAVYSNTSLATLQPVAAAVGTSGRLGPFVRFNGVAGVTYHIAIAGYDEDTYGSVRLAVAPGGIVDTNPPIVTVLTPASGLIQVTNRLFVSGTAVEPGPGAYGIRDVTISVQPQALHGLPMSTVVYPARSLFGPLSTNWSSIVGLAEGENNIKVVASDFAGNRSAPVELTVTYRPLDPPNDFFVNAIMLTNLSGVTGVNTLQATKETGEPNHAGISGGKSAWWSFVAPADGVLTLNTAGSTFDTLLGLYTGTAVNQLTLIAANDDDPGGTGGSSRIAQAVRANQTYHIALDGYLAASGSAFLAYQFVTGAVYHVTVTAGAGGDTAPHSADVASNAVFTVSALPGVDQQFDSWSGSLFSLANPLSVTVRSDLTLHAEFLPVPHTDGFESGGLSQLGWIGGGNQPWLVQTNTVKSGQFAARSGYITHNQTSSLLLTTEFRAGDGSFDYRVSSEAGFDWLRFYVDGVLSQQWSGELGWSSHVFPLTAGTHTLEWRYVKDGATSSGLDAAFVDNVDLPLIVATNASTPAYLQLHQQADGIWFVDLTGQPDQNYVFQNSSNLVSWQSFATNVALGGFTRALDPSSSTNSPRFYRALVP